MDKEEYFHKQENPFDMFPSYYIYSKKTYFDSLSVYTPEGGRKPENYGHKELRLLRDFWREKNVEINGLPYLMNGLDPIISPELV